jgi:tetratricopeptide (TPR) repeat protein
LRTARIALLIGACIAPALPAAAQSEAPTVDDKQERARELHERGLAAYDAERYDEAIVAFREAYELSPVPGILFNLAQAHLAKGPRSCPEARRAFSMYLQASPSASNRSAVQARIDELNACADAEERRRAEEAAAPVSPSTPAPSPAPRERPGANAAEPKPLEESDNVPWLALGVGGLGVVAAAVGVVFYASAGSDYDELKSSCRDQCAPSSWEDAAERERTGLVLIGVGGAVAIGSLVVWLATGRSGKAPTRATAAIPSGFVATW